MAKYEKIKFRNIISDCRCKTKADIFISKIENEDIKIAFNIKHNKSHFIIGFDTIKQMTGKMKNG